MPPITGNGDGASVSLLSYLQMVRQNDKELQEERDRRYAEVNVEKEKALKIKETADLAALQLAREIQTYKDEKANELREQIGSERNLYATKDEMASAIREVIAELKGRHSSNRLDLSVIIQVLAFIAVAGALIFHP